MPYIKQTDRAKYDFITNMINEMDDIETKGDLEYIVTVLMKKYMKRRDKNYSNLHDVVYAVQHCADEFRRRHLDKREDYALETNGDVD